MSNDPGIKLQNVLPKNNVDIKREAPLNLGAEQALLGAIISNNLALEKVEDFLEAKHFSTKINAIIFQTLKKLITDNQIADLNTLKVFLESNEDFINNGGIGYLLKISENSVSIINAKQYGELIHDLFLRRQLIDIGTNLVNQSYSDFDDQNSNSLIEKMEFPSSINHKKFNSRGSPGIPWYQFFKEIDIFLFGFLMG